MCEGCRHNGVSHAARLHGFGVLAMKMNLGLEIICSSFDFGRWLNTVFNNHILRCVCGVVHEFELHFFPAGQYFAFMHPAYWKLDESKLDSL